MNIKKKAISFYKTEVGILDIEEALLSAEEEDWSELYEGLKKAKQLVKKQKIVSGTCGTLAFIVTRFTKSKETVVALLLIHELVQECGDPKLKAFKHFCKMLSTRPDKIFLDVMNLDTVGNDHALLVYKYDVDLDTDELLDNIYDGEIRG